jgi:hypothetical protein
VSEIKTPPRPLVDLRPEWIEEDGQRVGIRFDCPCGAPLRTDLDGGPMCPAGRTQILISPWHPRVKPEHAWQHAGGDTFADLTLSPSLHWPGHWHGWMRGGVLESC